MPSSRAPSLVALALGVVAALAVLAACGGDEAPATTATPAPSTTPGATATAPRPAPAAVPALCGPLRVRVTGRVDAPEATELSGLVASPAQKGVLWANNDSGDRARLFALRSDGSLIASLDVPGAAAVDWEDVAAGPGDTLVAADVGDNGRTRASIDLYAIPEPRLSEGPATTAPATRTSYTYPDGAHDAETLLVDRRSGEVVVVTKQLDGRSGVYAGTLGRGGVLRKTTTLRLGLGGLATAGDVSADGRVVAIRTYTTLYGWARKPGTSLAATLKRRPCAGSAPLAREGQGEALALSRDGTSFLTVPEGANPAIRKYQARGGAR